MNAPRRMFIPSAALALAMFPASPFVTDASAWQCTEIVEYVEMWDDAAEENSSLGLYFRGIADGGGEPCSVTVRTYVVGPDNNEWASVYGYGSGYAESTAVIYLNESNAIDGDYTGTTEAWSQGVHYGCAMKFGGVAAFTANYQKTGETSTSCSYFRCQTGSCGSASGSKARLFPGGCPQYVKFFVLRVDLFIGTLCYWSAPFPIPHCGA